MIEFNEHLKNFLSSKYGIDKKLIYHFGFDENMQKFKMVYHSHPKTFVKYIDSDDMRNYILRLKLQKLISTIKIKKEKFGNL